MTGGVLGRIFYKLYLDTVRKDRVNIHLFLLESAIRFVPFILVASRLITARAALTLLFLVLLLQEFVWDELLSSGFGVSTLYIPGSNCTAHNEVLVYKDSKPSSIPSISSHVFP